MTGDHIEEMVDLLLVVHGDLCVARVTANRMITILSTTATRLFSAAAFLCLNWEGHPLRGVNSAVDDKHGSVLSLVELVSLAVQAEN